MHMPHLGWNSIACVRTRSACMINILMIGYRRVWVNSVPLQPHRESLTVKSWIAYRTVESLRVARHTVMQVCVSATVGSLCKWVGLGASLDSTIMKSKCGVVYCFQQLILWAFVKKTFRQETNGKLMQEKMPIFQIRVKYKFTIYQRQQAQRSALLKCIG